MKMLAIDASTKSSGIAIFEGTTLLGFSTIKASSSDVI
jgi:tRNA A37 threonylcarbamoyladenosine modification protein TsaB